MDWKSAFNVAVGIAGVLVGWLGHIIWEAQRRRADQLRELEIRLPNDYAKKTEVEKLADALFRKLDGIADTQVQILLALDGKEDRKRD